MNEKQFYAFVTYLAHIEIQLAALRERLDTRQILTRKEVHRATKEYQKKANNFYIGHVARWVRKIEKDFANRPIPVLETLIEKGEKEGRQIDRQAEIDKLNRLWYGPGPKMPGEKS